MTTTGERWLDFGVARLRFRLDGSGTPILLVHEMGGALESWDGVIEALGGGWMTLRYDQRGAGQSSPITGTADIDRSAADAVAVLDAAGFEAPVLVVASALGCATAVRLAAEWPDRVASLLLLTPALGVPEERRDGVRAVADRIESEGAAAFIGSTLDLAYPARFREPAVRFARFREIQFANDGASLAAYWRMLADIDLTADQSRLTIPVIVLAGGADQIRPPAHVPRLPNAEFEIVDSGHFIAVQTPDIVAAAIVRAAAPSR